MNELQQLTRFLQGYNPDQQALDSVQVLFSMLLAAVLGVLLGFLYRGYYRGSEPMERSVGRSFVLITPAVTLIFTMVQFSLPLSLGLLGALSFVRFRTPIKRAEDIGFILIMIGIGLSCAVGYFLGGIMLLLLVAAICVLRIYAPQVLGFATSTLPLLTIRASEAPDFEALAETLKPFGKAAMVSTQHYDDRHSLVLTLDGHYPARNSELLRVLEEQAGGGWSVDVYFPDNQLAE